MERINMFHRLIIYFSLFGGVKVSGLAIVDKAGWFKPGRGDGFLRA
jgi:hypothetical protein